MSPATAALFDAMGDATRRAIVSRIARGPVSVSALAQPLGVTVTAIGQHLRLLENAGLVRTEKIGRIRNCALRTDGLRTLEDWARACRADWEMRLDRLGDVLDEMP